MEASPPGYRGWNFFFLKKNGCLRGGICFEHPFSIDTSSYFEDGSLLSSAPQFFGLGAQKCQSAKMCIYNSWILLGWGDWDWGISTTLSRKVKNVKRHRHRSRWKHWRKPPFSNRCRFFDIFCVHLFFISFRLCLSGRGLSQISMEWDSRINLGKTWTFIPEIEHRYIRSTPHQDWYISIRESQY